VEANAALVWADRIVVLHSIAPIGTKISVIVFPIYAKNNYLYGNCVSSRRSLRRSWANLKAV
jgi:hypothetical protein